MNSIGSFVLRQWISFRAEPAYQVILAVVLMGLVVRLWIFPPLFSVYDSDEVGYSTGGLLVLEGITPGFKFSPAGIITWMGFAYGAAASFFELLSPRAEIAQAKPVIKPLLALDVSLFDIYADLSGLRLFLLVVILVIALVGIVMAGKLGRHYSGWSGALLCSGLMALLPAAVLISAQTRPYAMAWALGISAIALAACAKGRWAVIGAGVVWGLAFASRIEMVLLAPILAWHFWFRPDRSDLRQSLAQLVLAGASAVGTFLIVAPWYVTHLVGNFRKAATVKLTDYPTQDPSYFGYVLFKLFWYQGLGPVLLLIAAGLVLCRRGERIKALAAGLILLLFFFNSNARLQHSGPMLVSVIALAPFCLTTIRDRLPKEKMAKMFLALTPGLLLIMPLVQIIDDGMKRRASWIDHQAVDWIEANVPAGTRVYHQGGFVKELLPSKSAGEAFWVELTHPIAWRKGLERGFELMGIELGNLPLALSMEHQYQAVGVARRNYLLSGQYIQPQRPRYDLKYYGGLKRKSERELEAIIEKAQESFRQEGGVFVSKVPIGHLGKPAISWQGRKKNGVYVYSYLPPSK